MQAIVTKFIGPSNTRGSRIKARAQAGTVTVSYDHSKPNIAAVHAVAAEALARKMGWDGEWTASGHPDGNGYIFVCVTTRPDIVFTV